MKQPGNGDRNKENAPYVIGIAGNYEEAVTLVCRIVEEAVAQNGNADLKGYLFPEAQAVRKAYTDSYKIS